MLWLLIIYFCQTSQLWLITILMNEAVLSLQNKFLMNGGNYISPFHDIPLYANSDKTVLNMVVEMPRWSHAKMEMYKFEHLNPIKQEKRKKITGQLRFVNNCFPYHGIVCNYGFLPQTYGDPTQIDIITGCKGDDNPLDVCDISSRHSYMGQVKQVKIIGAFAIVDKEEADWKIIAIDILDKMANTINDIPDLNENMPHMIEYLLDWFYIYKVPTGKPFAKFAFQGQAQSKTLAYQVITDGHSQWHSLITGKQIGSLINLSNTTLRNGYTITNTDAASLVSQFPNKGPPHTIPKSVQTTCFVKKEA